mmetsp:Transcript_10123/g.24565  ORF Transcript_10123/g.24565 Transcript_10123/m.24565 type:complete len:85 (+) Transcript_10123:2-256(+)
MAATNRTIPNASGWRRSPPTIGFVLGVPMPRKTKPKLLTQLSAFQCAGLTEVPEGDRFCTQYSEKRTATNSMEKGIVCSDDPLQ